VRVALSAPEKPPVMPLFLELAQALQA